MSLAAQKRSAPRLRLRLSPAGERSVRAGHPWIYESSIRDQNRDGQNGELAIIYDRENRFLAVGLYDPASVIRVRVLHAGSPQNIDAEWFERQLQKAVSARAAFLKSPTTGYRLVNGESDGWPGLVLDKYDRCLVLKLYTAAWFPCLPELLSVIQKICVPDAVVLRLSRNIQECALQTLGLAEGATILGDPPRNPVLFLENGFTFEADVLRGQKTGFFLDQRDNRKLVGEAAEGRSVLNAFSFSGAFSVYAAGAGARSVTDLDISVHALESSRRNHQLNSANPKVSACERDWVQADVFAWLQGKPAGSFDLVILDPPSLARRETERQGAISAYGRLVRLGARLVKCGGMLAAFSCSAHVSEKEFFEVCLDASRPDDDLKVLQTTGHAADHPAGFPEAKYLKGIFFQKEKGCSC
jgi:23S rRNA (cytosine1962-C5)-methyltransferase